MMGFPPDLAAIIAIFAGAVAGLVALYFFRKDVQAGDQAINDAWSEGFKDGLCGTPTIPTLPQHERLFSLILNERVRRFAKGSASATVSQALMRIDIHIAGIKDRGGDADPKALQALASIIVTCLEAAEAAPLPSEQSPLTVKEKN